MENQQWNYNPIINYLSTINTIHVINAIGFLECLSNQYYVQDNSEETNDRLNEIAETICIAYPNLFYLETSLFTDKWRAVRFSEKVLELLKQSLLEEVKVNQKFSQEAFDKFWSLYPSHSHRDHIHKVAVKGNKKKILTLYKYALKTYSDEQMYASLEHYIEEHVGNEYKYIKNFQTYMSQEHYIQYIENPPEKVKRSIEWGSVNEIEL